MKTSLITHYERLAHKYPGSERLFETIRADADILHSLRDHGFWALAALTSRALDHAPDPYTFDGLAETPFMRTLADLGIIGTSVTAAEAFALASHRRAGRKVFVVADALSRQLVHTELHGVTADQLRLPYRSIYVAVEDPGSTPFNVYDDDYDHHPRRMVGLFITEAAPRANDERVWEFLIVYEPDPIGYATLGQYRVLLTPGRDLAEPMETEYYDLKKRAIARVRLADLPWREHSITRGEYYSTPGGNDSEQIFRWAMNAILYATMPGADMVEGFENSWYAAQHAKMLRAPEGSSKRARLERDLNQTTIDPQRRIYLGRSLPKWAPPSEASGTGAPLIIRTLVTGHWRNQPIGPGRTARKRIWIQPFWRGPEGAPISNPRRVIT